MVVITENRNNIIINVDSFNLHYGANRAIYAINCGTEYLAYSGINSPDVFEKLLNDIQNHKINKDSVIKFHEKGYDICDY